LSKSIEAYLVSRKLHMRLFCRVALLLLVAVNLTLTCQGHDTEAGHTGPHLALLAASSKLGMPSTEYPDFQPSTQHSALGTHSIASIASMASMAFMASVAPSAHEQPRARAVSIAGQDTSLSSTLSALGLVMLAVPLVTRPRLAGGWSAAAGLLRPQTFNRPDFPRPRQTL